MRHEQQQFLDVIDRDEAERRWHAALGLWALSSENVALDDALGRTLQADVVAPVDVPGFDRSNVDGYALCSADSFGAAEEGPCILRLNDEILLPGRTPQLNQEAGTATEIATGAVVPRGADAVVMIEHTDARGGSICVYRPVTPGSNISFAGSDMARGELVLPAGTAITAREIGVLAALGFANVPVVRRPVVAILSTGDELVALGEPARLAGVFDANQHTIAAAVRELGGMPRLHGIVTDDAERLREALDRALVGADLVILSGGTSKGQGDLCYRVVDERRPGVLVHGVALKPGKPVCLGAIGRTPVAILPGFPTSAIFTFHEFVAPVVRMLAGTRSSPAEAAIATIPARINSESGRTEYVLVALMRGDAGVSAYPLGKGSGSVTAFARADGFVTIPIAQEYVEAGETVEVTRLGRGVRPVDVVAIGSHCTGLDYVLARLHERGFSSKTLWIGSESGLAAAARGDCDIAGIHLFDTTSGEYNEPFLPGGVRLLRGYGRTQGVVVRAGDHRFRGAHTAAKAIARALGDSSSVMVNRNRGSGTRVLVEGLLNGVRPTGYSVEMRSHNAVCAAVSQNRADWGVAIEPVARAYGLRFLPLRVEQYDFAVPASRWDRPAVAAFRQLLSEPATCEGLRARGFLVEVRG